MRRPIPPNEKRKRQPEPDIVYESPELAKFINYVMQSGKKIVAQKVVYEALDIIARKAKDNPINVFKNAIENASPAMELRSRRVGGANYQVPIEVKSVRRFTLACRWIIGAARAKKGRPLGEKLAEELMLAAKNEGTAIKKKNDTHRMAEANRAFAHFAW